jgi:hypothetical protein
VELGGTWRLNVVAWEQELIDNGPDHGIAKHVCTAISRVLQEDAYLLKVDANERSVSHRLAIYLEAELKDEFPDWDVDCEYNRDGHEPKTLRLTPTTTTSADADGTTVYPDIIVHKRGQQENLLAIEIKKNNRRRGMESDLLKLQCFRRDLHYRFALFVRFTIGPEPAGIDEVQWVQ